MDDPSFVLMGGLWLMIALIGLAASVVWVWALVSCLTVPSDTGYKTGSKLIWVLVILFGHLLGALIYLAVGRPDPAAARYLEQRR